LENAIKRITEIDILQSNGIIVAERPLGKELPWEFEGYTRSRDYKYGKIICWSLLAVSYIAGLFIPYGRLDFIAVAVLSLGVGIQIQSIRKVNGVDVATTMCTGSIRSMTEKIIKYIKTKDKSLLLGIMTYFCIVIAFTSGVIISALIIKAL
jgi:uncharacterized membrane protein YoaK (UPF0700 family)